MTQDRQRGEEQGPEMGELLDGLAQAERARRRRALVIGLAVAVVAALGTVLVFHFRSEVFRPQMDVAGGETEVLELTNDPQCRGFIARVSAIGKDYYAYEPTLEGVLDADAEGLRAMDETLGSLRERLESARSNLDTMNLRYDTSKDEIVAWFGHVENELSLLERLVDERLAEVAPAPAADEPDAEAGAEAPVEGTVVVEGRDAQPDGSEKGEFKSKKTPRERLDGALLAVNDAFQSFRVWHTGGLHPCGAADPGETPWTPTPAEASAAAPTPME